MNNNTHLTLLELKQEIEQLDYILNRNDVVDIITTYIDREKPISIDEYKRDMGLSYANDLDFTQMGNG